MISFQKIFMVSLINRRIFSFFFGGGGVNGTQKEKCLWHTIIRNFTYFSPQKRIALWKSKSCIWSVWPRPRQLTVRGDDFSKDWLHMSKSVWNKPYYYECSPYLVDVLQKSIKFLRLLHITSRQRKFIFMVKTRDMEPVK